MSNPVHTSETRMCGGSSLKNFYCLEGSTSRNLMRKSQSGTVFQTIIASFSPSEGILSFVEYAPRLLIVLPSRQFRIYNNLADEHSDCLADEHRDCLAVEHSENNNQL